MFDIKEFIQRDPVKRWGMYCIKAAVFFGVLFLVSRFLPKMPAIAVALSWAALTAISAFVIAYRAVMRKVYKELKYQRGGFLSARNNGRLFCFIVAFCLASVSTAGLLLESSRWGRSEWTIAVAAVVLYAVVFLAWSRVSKKEYRRPFRLSANVWWAGILTCLPMCLLYVVMGGINSSMEYSSLVESIANQKLSFDNSPSILLSEVGKFLALSEGATAYAQSFMAKVNYGAYFVWELGLSVVAFYALANILGAAILGMKELKSVFQPLSAIEESNSNSSIQFRNVLIACALTVLVAISYCAVDFALDKACKSDKDNTPISRFVRSQSGLSVYVDENGHLYDRMRVDALTLEAKGASEMLTKNCEESLDRHINDSFDIRIQNVDAYLEWYYSVSADLQRFGWYVTKNMEGSMSDELIARIEKGVDYTELLENIESYIKQAEELNTWYLDTLSECRLDYDVPPWLLVDAPTIDSSSLPKSLRDFQVFTNTLISERFSKGADSISEEIANDVAGKILKDQEDLSVGDYLLGRAANETSRVAYKLEIQRAINESRADMLAMANVHNESTTSQNHGGERASN